MRGSHCLECPETFIANTPANLKSLAASNIRYWAQLSWLAASAAFLDARQANFR
jgi:hypothetical protein